MATKKAPAKTTRSSAKPTAPPAAPEPAADTEVAPDPTRLERLRRLRDRIEWLIANDDCCVCEKPKPSQVAPLAGRLVVVLEQIDQLEAAARKRGSRVHDLANRRQDRRAAATS